MSTLVARPWCNPVLAAPLATQDGRSPLRFATPVAEAPLRNLVTRGQTVAIVACDGTRAQPRDLMLPAVLSELDGIVRPEDVTVIVGTGTHRANSDDELLAMFGEDVVRSVRIINHDARDNDGLRWVGARGSAVPVWLNRHWLDANVRITTGFVEPHFFAGFSGGPKMVAPALAGWDTVLVPHDARRIGHPRATWGVVEGNPVRADIRSIAAATGVTFSLDVVLNCDKQVVAAFGGEVFAMHAAATQLARRLAMRPVGRLFDIVVTTNSGYPLDQSLYQSIKGISAACHIVRPRGTAVCAAECRDGFPDHGSFRHLLATTGSPHELLGAIATSTNTIPDQWQAQIYAMIRCKCRVVMHTSFLSDAELASVGLDQTGDVSGTIAASLAEAGPSARACILPEGPQTIAYLATQRSRG